MQKYRIALVGNPNSGKTTFFNFLTGLRHKVANYPGVTVEIRQGVIDLPGDIFCTLLDLPGIYSLSGISPDEIVAQRALLGEARSGPPPATLTAPSSSLDLIINVVDAAHLERGLFLTSQLRELGIPMMIVLTMSDIAHQCGISIKKELLARACGCPVFARPELRDERSSFINELVRVLSRPHPQASAPKAPASELESTWRSDDDIERRYGWIHQVVPDVTAATNTNYMARQRRIDAILTHKIWGYIIFLLIMATIFQSVFFIASYPMDLIEMGLSLLGATVTAYLPAGLLTSLLVDGLISGVGSVLVFVPQIAILFFLLSILEDSGYLARAAVIMDRVMRQFGLHGRSFVPLLSGFACAVPAIMSTRTIASLADRIATILVIPLVSCSARLPVYALLIGVFIPSKWYLGFISLQGLALLSLYILGIVGSLIVAKLARLTVLRGEGSFFVMELPFLRLPSLKNALFEAIDRARIFLRDAGSVILACSIVLWCLASFPQNVPVVETYAGRLGQLIQPLLAPLGYSWEICVAILSSFAAREVFVSSLATVFQLQASDHGGNTLAQLLRQRMEVGLFPPEVAYSLLVFYVFACMCMSTLAVAKRETGSWIWPTVMFFAMTLLAYGGAWITLITARAMLY